MPYRFDFFGDTIDSIRIFDIETQLSKEIIEQVEIIPDLNKDTSTPQISFFEFIQPTTFVIFSDATYIKDKINQLYDETLTKVNEGNVSVPDLHASRITGDIFIEQIQQFRTIEIGGRTYFKPNTRISFSTTPQPIFHKNFDLIAANLQEGMANNYPCLS